MKPHYHVKPSKTAPETSSWNGAYWDLIDEIKVDQFRAESSAHRPAVIAKATYSADCLHILFKVNDQFVRATHMSYQSMVCQDSCVEFFVRPRSTGGYLNFELNCCGTLHCSYIEDWTRIDGGFARWTPVPLDVGKTVSISSELKGPILDEVSEPVVWHVTMSIPFNLLRHYVGDFGTISGQEWSANFYKCGDKTSQPHWAAWAPVQQLNFHDPGSFGALYFK